MLSKRRYQHPGSSDGDTAMLEVAVVTPSIFHTAPHHLSEKLSNDDLPV
jgi:hypothetical protein